MIGFTPACELGYEFVHRGHAGGTANEDDFIQVGHRDLRVGQGREDRLAAALDQAVGQVVKFGARQQDIQVLGPVGIRGDKGQADLRLQHAREVNLGFFCGFGQPLQ